MNSLFFRPTAVGLMACLPPVEGREERFDVAGTPRGDQVVKDVSYPLFREHHVHGIGQVESSAAGSLVGLRKDAPETIVAAPSDTLGDRASFSHRFIVPRRP